MRFPLPAIVVALGLWAIAFGFLFADDRLLLGGFLAGEDFYLEWAREILEPLLTPAGRRALNG